MRYGQRLMIIPKTSLPFGHGIINLNEWWLSGKQDLRGNGDREAHRRPAPEATKDIWLT